MRILALICLCLASLYGQQNPSAKPAGEAQNNQQKARGVIDQMIQALGGQAYMTRRITTAEGRSGSFHNESLVGSGLYFRFWKWPDKDRIELTKQRDIVQLYVGDRAFEITYRGIHPILLEKDEKAKQAVVRRHYSLENVLREWLNEPGILLLDEGPGFLKGTWRKRSPSLTQKMSQ